MPDEHKKFHEFALQSALFKGRSDWYFCYLKSEKIAHVLAMLVERATGGSAGPLQELAHSSAELPQTMVHFAAGEVELAVVLADIFSLLSILRLCATQGSINKENSAILVQEYEQIVQKLAASGTLSPFVSANDFAVSLPAVASPASGLSLLGRDIKDNYKGHLKPHKDSSGSKHNEARLSLILDFVKQHKGVSIKAIAGVVKGCSEKTIQRELSSLIAQGLVRKQGERRWSIYLSA